MGAGQTDVVDCKNFRGGAGGHRFGVLHYWQVETRVVGYTHRDGHPGGVWRRLW